MKRQITRQILALLLSLLSWTSSGATPAIIPLPQQMQVRPGAFTLCSPSASSGASGYAPTKILVDNVSLETGQYLAELLSKSTGYRFQVVLDNTIAPVKSAILLTTANALTNLGA